MICSSSGISACTNTFIHLDEMLFYSSSNLFYLYICSCTSGSGDCYSSSFFFYLYICSCTSGSGDCYSSGISFYLYICSCTSENGALLLLQCFLKCVYAFIQYKTYRDAGLLIGSGPVEAAHRSVIQQRMKLSGQKWSIKGAQAIANLRCYKYSGAWNMIENVVKVA
jgi:hypothetical protein